jgi:hypothetical protein
MPAHFATRHTVEKLHPVLRATNNAFGVSASAKATASLSSSVIENPAAMGIV